MRPIRKKRKKRRYTFEGKVHTGQYINYTSGSSRGDPEDLTVSRTRGRKKEKPSWLPRTSFLFLVSFSVHLSIYPSNSFSMSTWRHRGGKKICLPRKPPFPEEEGRRVRRVERLIGSRDCDAELRQRPIGRLA